MSPFSPQAMSSLGCNPALRSETWYSNTFRQGKRGERGRKISTLQQLELGPAQMSTDYLASLQQALWKPSSELRWCFIWEGCIFPPKNLVPGITLHIWDFSERFRFALYAAFVMICHENCVWYISNIWVRNVFCNDVINCTFWGREPKQLF